MLNSRPTILKALTIFLFSLLLGASCRNPSDSQKQNVPRNSKWATPIEKTGLPNLHLVADGLYRGAQPKPAGFAELKKMGIKTIINLRALHTDFDEIEEAGLEKDEFKHSPIPLNAWKATDKHIIQFLKVVNTESNRPIFFHCQHGADRTGTMAAAYRVVVEGWSKENALQEMTDGGFGFHAVWKNLIEYMNALDVEKIRKEAGISNP